jgi:hypothetical protein
MVFRPKDIPTTSFRAMASSKGPHAFEATARNGGDLSVICKISELDLCCVGPGFALTNRRRT